MQQRKTFAVDVAAVVGVEMMMAMMMMLGVWHITRTHTNHLTLLQPCRRLVVVVVRGIRLLFFGNIVCCCFLQS